MSSIETMRFICAGCGYRARIPSSYTGKVILCPGCQQMQIATADAGEATGDTVRVSKVATAQGTAKFSVADAEGRLRFTCSGCGFSAKLASSYAGKAISCPQCKSPQLIPPLQGPESAVGKAGPSSVQEPAAPADDGLTFDDEPAKPAAPPAPAARSAAKAEVSDPADEISFDLEPAEPKPAARTAPAGDDATKPTAAAKSMPAKPTTKPGSGGVVRRGSRVPLPTAPVDEDDDVEDETEEETTEPSRPLPAWAQRLKEPRMMAIVGGSAAALLLLIVLIHGWSSASSAAEDYRVKAEASDTKAKELAKLKIETEFNLSKATEEVNRLKKVESDAKAALAAAETRLNEMGEQLKKAEGDKAEEYTKRKKAEADFDDAFAKLKVVEKKRDEEYSISTELRRKYEEETKLRKALKQRLDEVQAASK